jgi:hypothetical protein
VKEGSNQGVLIFGASKFSRELASILISKNIKVILADNNWDSIRQARMDNIPVYFGNPASEHASNFMDLSGIGRVLVMSPYRQLNPLVTFHFQDLMGTEKVYGLNNADSASARHQLSESYLKRLCLFGENISYAKIASLMAKGAVLKITNITENFTYDHFKKRYGDTAMPLVYLTKEGKVKVISGVETIVLPVGIELISLLPQEAQDQAVIQRALDDEADRQAKIAAEAEAKVAAEARAVREAQEAEQRTIEKARRKEEELALFEQQEKARLLADEEAALVKQETAILAKELAAQEKAKQAASAASEPSDAETAADEEKPQQPSDTKTV